MSIVSILDLETGESKCLADDGRKGYPDCKNLSKRGFMAFISTLKTMEDIQHLSKIFDEFPTGHLVHNVGSTTDAHLSNGLVASTNDVYGVQSPCGLSSIIYECPARYIDAVYKYTLGGVELSFNWHDAFRDIEIQLYIPGVDSNLVNVVVEHRHCYPEPNEAVKFTFDPTRGVFVHKFMSDKWYLTSTPMQSLFVIRNIEISSPRPISLPVQIFANYMSVVLESKLSSQLNSVISNKFQFHKSDKVLEIVTLSGGEKHKKRVINFGKNKSTVSNVKIEFDEESDDDVEITYE